MELYFEQWKENNKKNFTISSHSVCDKSIPRLGNALIQKDAYGCIDGFEWNYAKTKEGQAFNVRC